MHAHHRRGDKRSTEGVCDPVSEVTPLFWAGATIPWLMSWIFLGVAHASARRAAFEAQVIEELRAAKAARLAARASATARLRQMGSWSSTSAQFCRPVCRVAKKIKLFKFGAHLCTARAPCEKPLK